MHCRKETEMHVEYGAIDQNCDVVFLRMYWFQQIELHQLPTAVTVAHCTSCTAGSCMECLSPAEGDLRQFYGSSKTALGSAFN